MKEDLNADLTKLREFFYADGTDELIRLSDVIRNDGLRYERLLDAEEETDEL